jgi:gamma-D-glutamyl-L-lysine dipeptidyl-peptidase
MSKIQENLIIAQALKYFNAPYLWGGRSPFGIDCSGLTQVIYKMAGIKIPQGCRSTGACRYSFQLYGRR